MRYRTGEDVIAGDSVLIEHGRTLGVLHAVIETAKQMADWGLDEQAIMIESEPFGLVAWSPDDEGDPVQFVGRDKK